jgi:myo-inositol-1(or 4)-monophosphatase
VLERFPDHAIYGEEGIAGNQASEWQWIIDPIDGTVNYFYGIPHFSISIALRRGEEIVLGVICDPMRDEMWQIERGGTPLLNGAPIAVSPRARLEDAILSVGFAKSNQSIRTGLPLLQHYAQQVRKCRMMGSATLDMAYVACGRLDGYIESTISLWDIAAGKLLVEAAGGSVTLTPRADKPNKYSIIASSGRIPLSFDA